MEKTRVRVTTNNGIELVLHAKTQLLSVKAFMSPAVWQQDSKEVLILYDIEEALADVENGWGEAAKLLCKMVSLFLATNVNQEIIICVDNDKLIRLLEEELLPLNKIE